MLPCLQSFVSNVYDKIDGVGARCRSWIHGTDGMSKFLTSEIVNVGVVGGASSWAYPIVSIIIPRLSRNRRDSGMQIEFPAL